MENTELTKLTGYTNRLRALTSLSTEAFRRERLDLNCKEARL